MLYQTQAISLGDMIQAMKGSNLLAHYLDLFTDVKRQDVEQAMIEQLTLAQENNTLGYRLITTLLHQYFIKGGFVEKETKKVTFQQKLSFNKVQP